MSGTITADILPALSTLSGCVFLFQEKHHHSWHVSTSFDSQWVRSSVLWVAPSWLTCSRLFRLSAGVYFHIMSSTIISDMFLPFSIIRKCVSPFHKQHSHGWHVPASFDYQKVRISISWAAPSPRLTCSRSFRLSKCVFPFHEQHHHTWHVPRHFWLSGGA